MDFFEAMRQENEEEKERDKQMRKMFIGFMQKASDFLWKFRQSKLQEYLRHKVWVCNDGRRIKIAEMTDLHLQKCVWMLLREGEDHSHYLFLDALKEELERRSLKNSFNSKE